MSIASWLRRLKRRRFDDDDLQDEIRAHLAIATDERVAGGDDPATARQASIKDFGNVTLTREAAHRVWTPHWVDAVRDLGKDVLYGARALARQPAFSLAVIGVLAIGIGLNAAVFTMLKGIGFSPIAGVSGSAQLFSVFGETGAGRPVAISYPEYQVLRDRSQAFAGLFGSDVGAVGLGRGPRSRSLWAEFVTGNYFQVLGIAAERGRTLALSDESAPGREPVVVLSDGLWRRDFDADPDIVGRTIEINHSPLTVVGVADPTFHGTTVVYDVELFIPITIAPQLGFRFNSQKTSPADVLADRTATIFYPQSYLRPGTTLASAAAEMDSLWTALSTERPMGNVVQHLKVTPFWRTPEGAPGILLPTLIVLSAMGVLVLLIACANIAGLVLVRGLSRRGEIALRLALGAGRARIVRLLIVESLVLALPGAILGILIASRGMPIFTSYAEALAAPRRVFFNVEVDGLVLVFAVAVAALCALVFGLVPALQSSRIDLASVMNEVSPRAAARGRMRAALVVAQVAVSLLLLVGAGLVTRSLNAALTAYPGFDARSVTSIQLDLKQNGYDETRGRIFYHQLIDAARADATTESATLGAYEVLAFLETPARQVDIDGYAKRRDEDLAFLSNTVSPDYFRTLRIPLVAGREFQDRDDENGTPVAVVNATLAERFWGGATNAIGRRVRIGDGDWRTVVGVAADVKYIRVDESPRPYLYVPLWQSYRSSMILHTRGSAPTDVLVDRARTLVTTLDADLPLLYVRALNEQLKGSTMLFKLSATMLFLFGVAGIALAALGTYGLVSYTVTQSTHEIGIRMALGAGRVAVVREFVRRGLRLGAIGAALGLVAALGVGQVLRGVLFGVSATDAGSFARALGIVIAVVAIATLIPAWRASRTDPLRALRHQ